MESSGIDMYVVKRNGEQEVLSYDKILTRTKTIGLKFGLNINYTGLVMKVIDQLFNNIKTSEIDELMAQQCASMGVHDVQFSRLASLLVISNHQKEVNSDFFNNIEYIYNKNKGYLSDEFYNTVKHHKDELQNMIVHDRDYQIDYFGFKTLERAYLIKVDKMISERIQHMWMRVAIQIHGNNMERVKETYDGLSQKYFIHATPTLFNSGTSRPQLSSCYLLAMEDDSIDGIFNTLKDCASISKWAGGIGLHIHNVRAEGSHIVGTNGTSNGIVPMLRVFNNTARYVDQGGGRRNGSFAMYLEPWHADIEKFLELRKNHGDEEARARDLFYALWIPDLFMEKVEKNQDWYLMCPNISQNLSDHYGDEFRTLYEKYISEGKFIKKIKARELWFQILDSQMETGTPYMLYKDACNKKSNQSNIGVIKSSNLCTEIIEHSNADETAVCNLASISLSAMVNRETKKFDYNRLCEITKIVTRNLNNVIDVNFYPTDKTYRSNMRHRPIGLGVQGLADALALMDIPFHSEEALVINKNIFETIYYGAMYQSNVLSIERQKKMKELRELLDNDIEGNFYLLRSLMFNEFYSDKVMFEDVRIFDLYHELKPLYSELFGKNGISRDMNHVGTYSSFEGSPLSEGKFQFDLWNVVPESGMYDWESLRTNIMKYGVRNSLCVAPMPTASTSQILANNECFEPFTSNIYTRRTLAGEFIVINQHLMKELNELGLWNSKMKDSIVENKGSIQAIDTIPDNIKEKYKIVWEIPMKHVITMAKDRGAFICQSQSMNLWLEDPNYKNLTAMHLYSWKSGLKTGMYYLRRKAKHQAQQFTIEPELVAVKENEQQEPEEECLMCGA